MLNKFKRKNLDVFEYYNFGLGHYIFYQGHFKNSKIWIKKIKNLE
jgi:hypothetical protein